MIILAFFVLFLLYRMIGETGKATSALVIMLTLGMVWIGYTLTKFLGRTLTYRNYLRRIITDLWQHTDRYESDFTMLEEADAGKRLSLVDRIKLLIENNGYEDQERSYCLQANTKSLKSKYLLMQRNQLEEEISELERKLEDLHYSFMSDMTEACYGSSDCEEDDVDFKQRTDQRNDLLNKYSLALKSYVDLRWL